MVFLRRSLHIEMQLYNAEEFVSMDELKKRIAEVRKMKHRLRLQLMRECNHIDKEELEQFEYRLAKYMYGAESPCRAEQACRKGGGAGVQIPQPETAGKCHPGTDKGMGTQEADHRQGSRHHPQVHHLAERGAAQGKWHCVKTSYGFKLKQYAPRLLDKVTHKAAGIQRPHTRKGRTPDAGKRHRKEHAADPCRQ